MLKIKRLYCFRTRELYTKSSIYKGNACDSVSQQNNPQVIHIAKYIAIYKDYILIDFKYSHAVMFFSVK